MSEEYPNVLDVIMKAYEESEGKYMDMVVEHGELPGLTIEHLGWWGIHLNNPVNYKKSL